jgi:uncharacterized damage-inducible protein DinB
MDLTRWVERRFNFDFPPGLYPALVERITGTPARLEELVSGLGKETLVKRDGSAWSIQEHAGHLIDLDELHEKRLNQFIAGMNVLLPADMANKKTYLENHNKKDVKDILKKFRSVRTHFVEKLSGVDDFTIIRTAIHPRLNKEMRLVDMIYFIAEHDDHHLAIIRRLINKQL